MIQVENLTKSYGPKVAVANLTFDVHAGDVLGVLGPNGAGKTTAMRVLSGLLTPDSGRAIVAGHDIVREPNEAKKRSGYVPESPKVFETLSADAFLDVIASLYHMPPEIAAVRREELLRLLGLLEVRYERLAHYSKGMRQKVVIAAALIHDPDVLIFDEPFDGLDPSTIGLLKALLRQMAGEGKAIVFSSHIIDLVERVATRICIVHEGVKVAEGTVAEIRDEMRAATLEEAFARLTGGRDARVMAAETLSAMRAAKR